MVKTQQWRTPSGRIYNLYADMARQPHLLIAGATGSGKSVVERGIIHSLLFHSPARVQLVLIDPKRVELVQYKGLPHVIAYAADPSERLQALQQAVNIMEQRYSLMSRQGLRMYDGTDVYVIIDELADIKTTKKKAAVPLIQRLAQSADDAVAEDGEDALHELVLHAVEGDVLVVKEFDNCLTGGHDGHMNSSFFIVVSRES